MHRNSKRVYRAIAIVITTVAFAVSCSGQADGPSFTLSVALPQPKMKASTPIRLDLSIKNETNQVLFLGSIRNGGRRSGITMRNQGGETMPYKDDPPPREIYRFSNLGLGVEPNKRST
jgi:hypothetical protein